MGARQVTQNAPAHIITIAATWASVKLAPSPAQAHALINDVADARQNTAFPVCSLMCPALDVMQHRIAPCKGMRLPTQGGASTCRMTQDPVLCAPEAFNAALQRQAKRAKHSS